MRTVLPVLLLLIPASAAQAGPSEQRLSVPIPATTHTIIEAQTGHRILVDGYGTLRQPGVPQLPTRIVPIAIPPGAEVVSVTYSAAEPMALPERYDLTPAPVWEPIGPRNEQAYAAELQRFEANHAAIYSTNEPYPSAPIELVQTARYRGYNLVDVRVTPFVYRPVSGRVLHYEDLTVQVDYRLPVQPATLSAEDSTAVERTAKELILNHDQAATWYATRRPRDDEQYSFVVITTEDLTDAVEPLVTWEQQKGRTTNVVTVEWIIANYPGYDLAARIRNFLRDKYSADDWGIEYVLLVGGYGYMPMRVVWQDLGYGYPATDTYYAELSLPDSQSWDSDGDGHFAEDEDLVDFYTEICVGRIPWDDPTTVEHICRKSVLFEQNHDPTFKNHLLLLGSFFWPNTDCAVLMEAIAARPHLADWTATRMYESGYSSYWSDYDLTNANVVSEWSSGRYSVVTWGGHGSPTSAHRYYPDSPAFIQAADCPLLNDDYPSIVFADSCYTSCPSYNNLGREMLRRGAVGYVGATQVAGGRRGWEQPADGSSQTLNYLFTGYVTSGVYTQGEALQRALRDTYLLGAWRWPRYEMLEWGALYGNPDLSVAALPAIRIQFPDGLPEYVVPGTPTTVPVRVDPVLDTLTPGSETLHYRLDGGAFQAVPLTPLGSKDYEAILPPACCGHTPEFYVSAAGTQTGVVTEPQDAPNSLFTADVGTFTQVFHDDFEEFKGWMIENLGATDGQWQRDVPVNDPAYFYDPVSDADGSGKCCLTANRLGESDVDGGGVRLTSPILNLTAPNVLLRYSFYLYADDQEASDYLLVEVSSNGLAGPWRELVRHIRNNGLSWRTDSFSADRFQTLGIPLTDQMHVRFTAHDGSPDHMLEAGVDAFEVLSFNCSAAHPGDLNDDCLVNLDDFALLADCLSGPQMNTPPPDCDLTDFANADFDADGDLDLGDCAAFQIAFPAG